MPTDSIASLDRLLRSVTQDKPPSAEVQAGEDTAAETNAFSITAMLIVLVILAMFYGLCMGSYSLFKPVNLDVVGYGDRWLQMIASMIKVPLLYALTILVTFPSLYVFSALVGTQLNFQSFIRLMITLLAINLAVLASLGPIVAFFSVSTINYRFMQVFNVAMFTVAGVLGLAWLLNVIRDLSGKVIEKPVSLHNENSGEQDSSGQNNTEQGGNAPDGIQEGITEQARTVLMPVKWIFRTWIIAFCLVGSQLGWVLRPFIGNPEIAFTWLRARESNFFIALFDILINLFS